MAASLYKICRSCRRSLATSRNISEYEYRNIPRLGKKVSRVGFGGYRLTDKSESNKTVLKSALLSGINVVDTSSHFEDGQSERLIGETIQVVVNSSEINRKDVTVVTKAGFITPNIKKDLDNAGIPNYQMLNEANGHSLHPSFLDHQIETSLDRLKTNQIDIFLLNNPERLLNVPGYSKSQLYTDIQTALTHLSSHKTAGRISGFGICSNTIHLPSSPYHFSVREVYNNLPSNIKEGFVAIQYPLNIYEREGIEDECWDDKISLSRFAKAEGIYQMTQRPLNAIASGEIRRLTTSFYNEKFDPSISESDLSQTLADHFDHLAALEDSLSEILPSAIDSTITNKFIWSSVLAENLQKLTSNFMASQHFLKNKVSLTVQTDLNELINSIKDHHGDEENSEMEIAKIQDWVNSYEHVRKDIPHFTNFMKLLFNLTNFRFSAMSRLTATQHITALTNTITHLSLLHLHSKNTSLSNLLSLLYPALSSSPSLSQKVIRLLLGTDTSDTVLTGMRSESYVNEALEAWRMESGEGKLDREKVNALLKSSVLL
ncbi:NADP-dependent oxidoreductase domain-containing protein [Paraphysoderma sedebokerense]|nr:NADP-dependent oxidoreductase domain-containing protein [Paraphysoderma sedebokerense]